MNINPVKHVEYKGMHWENTCSLPEENLALFLEVTLCNLVGINRRFKRIYLRRFRSQSVSLATIMNWATIPTVFLNKPRQSPSWFLIIVQSSPSVTPWCINSPGDHR